MYSVNIETFFKKMFLLACLIIVLLGGMTERANAQDAKTDEYKSNWILIASSVNAKVYVDTNAEIVRNDNDIGEAMVKVKYEMPGKKDPLIVVEIFQRKEKRAGVVAAGIATDDPEPKIIFQADEKWTNVKMYTIIPNSINQILYDRFWPDKTKQ